MYGFGKSEEFLGEFMKSGLSASSPIIATKFAPLPWRLTGGSVPVACKESLQRLGLKQMGLYIQHWWVALRCTHRIVLPQFPVLSCSFDLD